MADIRPFRALQYDTSRVPLQQVVTQPYDKITPTMRQGYLAAHPNNLVRILRPLDEASLPSGVSPYKRAMETLMDWRASGVLLQSQEPALYAYYQRFEVPGTREILTRKGFVGLTRLADYSEGIVFPHEQTLSGPRADRLELLRHTRTHFGQVFLMYSDPELCAEALLDSAIGGQDPAMVRDEYDVDHCIWRISSPDMIESICSAMSDKKLLIADGHHRYETAIAFRDEERERGGNGPRNADWLMTTLVNMEGPGLVVLPTHRVLSDFSDFDADRLFERVREFYEVRDVGTGESLVDLLDEHREVRPALGVVVSGRSVLLTLLDGLDRSTVLPDISRRKAELDVVLLHRLVLERCLGLTENDVLRESFIRYVRGAENAVSEVREGRAQACFLLNPTPVSQVRDVAFGGEVLPQKSTDFFPKVLSGLTMYSMPES